MFFLGLDIGTTHSKALVTDRNGRIIYFSKAANPSYTHHAGWHEQHAEEIFSIAISLVQQCVQNLEPHVPVTICLSTAMHSLLLVDKSGIPLTPVMTWADTRSNAFAVRWKNDPVGKLLYRETGVPIHPAIPLCKIGWLREYHPQLFAKAYKFLSLKDFFIYKLTGHYLTDFNIASATGLFNYRSFQWHDAALGLAGIKKEQLADPVPVTHILPNLKNEFNFGRPVVLVAGASDGALANIGAGAINENDGGLTIGTSGAVRIFRKEPFSDIAQRLFCYAFEENMFLCGGATNNGGNLLDWFASEFLAGNGDASSVIGMAEQAEPGAGGIVFLPYVYGERAPVWDATAIPMFSGALSEHSLRGRARAVLEGVCFSLKQILNALEETAAIKQVYTSGGFTASKFWKQLLADILQKQLVIVPGLDSSALGAAWLAMKTTGAIKDWTDIRQLLPAGEIIQPDTDPFPGEIYQDHFKRYEGLYAYSTSLKQ
jgi:gluconokinase